MIQNYQPAKEEKNVCFYIVFDDGRGNGFCFPCDEHGELLPNVSPEARKNLEWCRQNSEKYKRAGEITREVYRSLVPARGTCDCGEEVWLENQYHGACQCPNCGQWYNMFGWKLNPPSEWLEPIDPD